MVGWIWNVLCALDFLAGLFERRAGQSHGRYALRVLARVLALLVIPVIAFVAAIALSGSPWWVELAVMAVALIGFGLAFLAVILQILKAVFSGVREALATKKPRAQSESRVPRSETS